jgi:hypothetical protein
VVFLAGQHQSEQDASIAAHDQYGPVLAVRRVVLVDHPCPHDLAGIRPAIEVWCVDHLAGPLRSGKTRFGHRPAGGEFSGRCRQAHCDDVRGDLHGLLDGPQCFLRVLQTLHDLGSLVEYEVLSHALKLFPL